MIHLFREILNGRSVDFTVLLITFFSYVALILVLMPVHEFAHAFVADRLGDKTPRWNGRLTLNPLAHINWMGAIMIMLFGIGFAQPVPVSPRHFKNARRDMALTALAGPVSNLLMAILSVIIFCIIEGFSSGFQIIGNSLYFYPDEEWLYYAYIVLIDVFAGVNISLAVFNLLPIPPLDGSRIFAWILPSKWAYWMDMYEQYITMGLFLLLFTGVLEVPLSYLQNLVSDAIFGVFGIQH